MKKSILISFLLIVMSYFTIAQTQKPTTTKPATTTVKKAPPKTTTTTTTKTTNSSTNVTKPAAPKPAETQKEATPAAEVVKQPTNAPISGPLVDGPKSYSNDPAPKTKSTGATKTAPVKTVKTAAPKPEKVKKTAEEAVRSYIGIRGGYNLSTVQDAQKQLDASGSKADIKNLAGYMGGLVINIGVSKVFSIQPEILYSQEGLHLQQGDDYFKGKIDFVNVPLFLKLAFGSPKVKFFINAGPYIGYKLSQKSELMASGQKTTNTIKIVKEYDSDGIKTNVFDFGAIGGAGLQFDLGGPLIVLEGRYQYGMADPNLYKNGKPAEVGNLGHNRVMTGTIGILFPLGGK